MFGYPVSGMKTLNLSRIFQLAGGCLACVGHIKFCLLSFSILIMADLAPCTGA